MLRLLAPQCCAGGALWQALQATTTTSAASSLHLLGATSTTSTTTTTQRVGIATSQRTARSQPAAAEDAAPTNHPQNTRESPPTIPLSSMEPLCPLTYTKPYGPTTSRPLLAFDEVFIDASSLTQVSARAEERAGERRAQDGRAEEQRGPLTAVFLHGLLGSSRNWRSFARRIALEAAAKANRDVRVLLVDLRCHGESAARFGFHPPHDLAAAAEDVGAVIEQHLGGAAPHLLVGLSLGGKVALQLLKQMAAAQEGSSATSHHAYASTPRIAPPEDRPAGASGEAAASSPAPHTTGLPQQVWVLDSQPGTVPLHVDAPTSVNKIIQLISAIPTPLESRQVLYRFLEDKGIPLPVAQWLGTSLAPGGRFGLTPSNGADQKLDWMFDIQGAAALYNSYRLSSHWDVATRPPPGTTVHIVRGQLSDRWTPAMLQQLQDVEGEWRAAAAEAPESVGQLQVHCLERAGHWVQADNPEGLHALMLPHFRDIHESHLQW